MTTPEEARAAIDRARAQQQESEGEAELATTLLSEVKCRPVHWLVPDLVPQGKLTMIAGDGGHGKSAATLDLIAGLSRGLCAFGLSYEAFPASDSLLISCEDDLADTVVPRLEAAGADLGRVRHVGGVKGAGGKVQSFNLLHYHILEAHLAANKGVRLVVIDPAGAYVGHTGRDDHKDSELRSLLAPLSELAGRQAVAIIIVKHLNKGAALKAVARVAGSTAYVNAVRSALLIAPDPQDEARKFLLPMKNNLAPLGKGIAYRLRPLDDGEGGAIVSRMDHLSADDREKLRRQLFCVNWLGHVSITADEAMARPDPKQQRDDAERAGDWLAKHLAAGPKPSEQCVKDGNKALSLSRPLKWWRDDVLKGRLGGKPVKQGYQGAWVWELPPRAPSDSLDSLTPLAVIPFPGGSDAQKDSPPDKEVKESKESEESPDHDGWTPFDEPSSRESRP